MDALAPEVLLAILGAAVTVYSLLPAGRRLQLHLRMRRLDWMVLLLSIVLVHYILFYPILAALGFALPLGPCRWGFTPALASYSVLLGAGLFVGTRAYFARLSRRRLPVFSRLLESLRFDGRYSELFVLLESNLEELGQAYGTDYPLARLRRRLAPTTGDLLLAAHKGENVSAPGRLRRWVAARLPTYVEAADQARDLVRRLLLSRELAERLASTRPYLALDLFGQPFRELDDFQDLWFAALLSNPNSVLHFEVQNNQNLASGSRYYIPNENRILRFCFGNAEVAKDRAVYRSFGEYILHDLQVRRGDPNDRYNRPMGNFRESECWGSGAFVSLRLFGIMVPEALHQGITWHMWLYYLPHIVDGILENLSPAESADPLAEWPTPYHFFLYEVVSMLRDWIEMAEEVPIDQENARLDEPRLFHDNASIPKSAVLALGTVMSKVLHSDRLSTRFKDYLFEMPLSTALDMVKANKRPEFGRLLLASVAQAGPHLRDDAAHRTVVADAFARQDHFLRFELKDDWAAAFPS